MRYKNQVIELNISTSDNSGRMIVHNFNEESRGHLSITRTRGININSVRVPQISLSSKIIYIYGANEEADNNILPVNNLDIKWLKRIKTMPTGWGLLVRIDGKCVNKVNCETLSLNKLMKYILS